MKRIRPISAAVAALAVFGLAGCASEQAGSPVTAESAAVQGSPASGDSTAAGTDASAASSAGESTAVSDPTASPTDDSSAGGASTDDSSTDGGEPGGAAPVTSPKSSDTETASSTDEPAPTTSAATSSGGTGAADVWPTEICKLMPGDVVKGLKLEDGDPQQRCMYTNTSGKYRSVMISKGAFKVTKDDPSGNHHGKQIKTSTIDGRPGWSWLVDGTYAANGAWATFDSGDGAALLGISDDSKSPEENRTAVLALAARVSQALRGDKPMSGAATAPPTTSHPKVPAGTRAWPGVVCDLMPQSMLDSMEKARGYESQDCRLSSETKTGFSKISVTRAVPPTDPKDPSHGMGKDLKKESFDGREAYSYLSGSGSVPTAYVVFATAGRDWAEIRVAESDVKVPVKPEKVRADALALAKQVAPKLPKP